MSQQPQQDIRPRYEVVPLTGTVERSICIIRKDKDGKPIGGFDFELKEEPAGFMVYFPNGSSIRVRTPKELGILGFDQPAALIDMESGDEVPQPKTVSLQEMSERKTKPTRNK